VAGKAPPVLEGRETNARRSGTRQPAAWVAVTTATQRGTPGIDGAGHMGHTARPDQVRRGRATTAGPQISGTANVGRCGSQADNAGSIPVTRSRRPIRSSGALWPIWSGGRFGGGRAVRAPRVPLRRWTAGLYKSGHSHPDGSLALAAGVLIVSAAFVLECPIRAISSRRLATWAANAFPVWRRSWKCSPPTPAS
jgi:hypothetical protein